MSGAVTAFALTVSGFIETAALTVGVPALGGLTGELIFSGVSLGITTGIAAGIGAAFAPKIPDPQARQTPLKQAMTYRQSATGTVRVAGAYALYVTGATHKNISYDVMAQLDGESDGVVAHYLNDDLMAKTSSGNYWYAPGAPGKYGGGGSREPNLVQIDTRDGLDTETAYPISSDVPAWTSTHRGDGVSSALLRLTQAKREDQAGDFPNGLATLSTVRRAQRLYDPRDGGQTQGDKSTYVWTDNAPLGLLGYLTDANGGMGLNWSRFFAPAVSYWQAVADEADGLVTTLGMHATLLDDAAAGDNKIFLADTTGLTGGTIITLLDGQAVTVSGLGLAGEVDLTGTLTNPHPAGELAYWSATGQQPRFRCNALYGHDTPPGDVIKGYLQTFDGWLGQRGDGALIPRTNSIYAPTVVLTDRHIVDIQVTHYLNDEQATNQLIVSYTDPASAYNKAEAGYVQDDIDIAARGVARSAPLDLQWVPSGPQAIAVARTVLARSTQPVRGTLTANLAGLAVLGERYIGIQTAELPALNDAIVEIVGKPTIDLQNMQVSFPFVLATGAVLDPAVQARVQEAVHSGSLTATLPAAPTEGSWLVALGMLGWPNGSAAPGAPPTAAAGWTVLDAHTAVTAHASDPSCAVAYRRAGAGESATQTPFTNGANGRYAVALMEVSGIGDDFTAALTSHALGVPATETGASTVTLSATASAPSTLAVALGAWYGGGGGVGSMTLSGSSWTHTVNTGGGFATAVAGSLSAGVAETVTATYHEVTFTNAYGLCGALLTFGGDGFSTTPGSSYTLPPLAPPSGAPLQPLAAPTIASVTPDYPDSGGGVSGARLLIVVSDEGDVAWKVRWKLSADTSWTEIAVSDPTGTPPELLTGLIAASGSIDVQVAYVTASQVSPWSATTTVTVAAPLPSLSMTASETITAPALVNIWNSSGAKVRNANASTAGKEAHGFILTTVSSGGTATVYTSGDVTGLSSLTPGEQYLATSAGGVTATAPSSTGQIVQRVGFAHSSTVMTFEPGDPVIRR
jgi:hypothetical protein